MNLDWFSPYFPNDGIIQWQIKACLNRERTEAHWWAIFGLC